MITTWKDIVQSKRGLGALIFCLISVMVMAFYMPTFYREVINPKKGFYINDPILNFLSPINWSLTIFIILYVAILQTIISARKRPDVILVGITTYCAVNMFRMLTMYMVTLEPPGGMILLLDPISSSLYPEESFAKDLFFSGHVSTMAVLIFIEKNRIARIAKTVGTCIVGLLLAWQHVHYTLDLIAAPIITFGFYLLVEKLTGVNEGSGS